MPAHQEVLEFLTAFKLAIGYERWHFKGRDRTEQDLINLNLTGRQAVEIICGAYAGRLLGRARAGRHRLDEGRLGVRIRPRGH